MTSTVHVEVSGLTGSGKSAVMGEIEIALKALGLKVEHGPDFQAEKNGTHADWQQALDLYQPTVVLTERNVSRQPPAREDAKTCYDCATDRPHRMAEACTHPAPDALRVVMRAAGFLLDRLRDLEWDVNERDFNGHVLPAASRLRQALATLQAEQKGGAE